MVEETSFKGNWCCFVKGSETQNFGFINWVNLALPQKSRRLLLPSSLSALRPYDGTTSIRNMNFQFRLFITFYDVDKRNFVVVSDSMENAWDKHGDKKYALDLPKVEMKYKCLILSSSRALLVCFVTCFVFSFLRPRAVLLFPSEPGAGSEKVKLWKLMVKRRRDWCGERETIKDSCGGVVPSPCRAFPTRAFSRTHCVVPKRLHAVDYFLGPFGVEATLDLKLA